MGQQIERELRNGLTAEEYQRLFDVLPFHLQTPRRQFNLYFDTPERQLKQRHMGLRLRQENETGECTLKVRLNANEKIEINDALTHEQILAQLAAQQIVTDGQVASTLATYQIDIDTLQPIGSLRNLRYEWTDAHGTWVLDQSDFPSGRAYEIEFEYSEANAPQAMTVFAALLAEHRIPQRQIPSKLARACQPQHHQGVQYDTD